MSDLLLDTHALLWWLLDDPRLSEPACRAIASPQARVAVSAASLWEIAVKNRAGKLRQADALLTEPFAVLRGEGFETVAIEPREALAAGQMDFAHRDPFDRMLIAQAILSDRMLVSNETLFDTASLDGKGLQRLW